MHVVKMKRAADLQVGDIVDFGLSNDPLTRPLGCRIVCDIRPAPHWANVSAISVRWTNGLGNVLDARDVVPVHHWTPEPRHNACGHAP